jgi:ABC-type polysaccharide transport system, permease component
MDNVIVIKKKKKITKKSISLFLLLLPAIALLFVFTYIPMYGIIISFMDFSPFRGIFHSPWIGLENFKTFLQDDKFWSVMKNTLIINFFDLAIGFTIPIIFAIVVTEVSKTFFKKFVQTLSYLPHFLSWVVISGLVYSILAPNETGLVNNFLHNIFGIEPIFFMASPKLFVPIIVLLQIWKDMGWSAILYFATIAGIDSSLFEAAEIDGAGRIRQIWHVTLPGMASIIVLMLLLNISSIFTIGFDRIFLLQNALVYDVSDVISTYIYKLGLLNAKFSLTTAIGLVQSTLGMLLVLSSNWLSKKISGLGLF